MTFTRTVEEQLRLSSLERLAGGVAHEINNPLAGVTACLRAIRRGAVDDESRERYFDAIEDGLKRMENVVRALLLFAHSDTGEHATEKLSAKELIAQCVAKAHALTLPRGVSFDISYPSDLPFLRGDRELLGEAIHEVILNAIEASPPRKKIVITGETREKRVELSVCDFGPGIPSEHRAAACEPFFTAKAQGEGRGLGLSLASGIASCFDGTLRIEDNLPFGTRVVFSFPSA